MKSYWKLAGAVLFSEVAGGIGAVFTTPKITTWYAGLNQPSWNPPAGVFGPVWTTLYALMGVSLWLLWESKDSDNKQAAISLFWWQLAVNVLWSVVFFGLEQPGLAVVVILVLLALIVAYIMQALRVNRWAAYLMLPYAAWVTFATALNTSVWLLNR